MSESLLWKTANEDKPGVIVKWLNMAIEAKKPKEAAEDAAEPAAPAENQDENGEKPAEVKQEKPVNGMVPPKYEEILNSTNNGITLIQWSAKQQHPFFIEVYYCQNSRKIIIILKFFSIFSSIFFLFFC